MKYDLVIEVCDGNFISIAGTIEAGTPVVKQDVVYDWFQEAWTTGTVGDVESEELFDEITVAINKALKSTAGQMPEI